jgi:exopolysaccharide biosynthesis predicted pyruvyltransferase EpsI
MKRKIKEKFKKYPLIYKILKIIYKPFHIPLYIKNYVRDLNIIKANLVKICDVKSGEFNIFYFGIPRHQNLGDLAQTYATNLWIKENYPNHVIVEFNTVSLFSKKFIDILEKTICDDNLVLLQSGYTSHEKHPDHKMHKIIVERFKLNRIVFLPQTVNIVSKREIEHTRRIFGSHKRLLFIARDEISFASINKLVPGINSLLFPDIVTYLINFMETSKNKNGVLFIIRDDNEMYYGLEEVRNNVSNKIENFNTRIDFEDTDLHYKDFDHLSMNFDSIFKEKIYHYSTYEAIVTDRYHGTVFGVLSNTPVVVLKTNYHKVKTGAEWLKKGNNDSVHITENLEQVINVLTKILENKKNLYNSPYFRKNYYSTLKSKIDLL